MEISNALARKGIYYWEYRQEESDSETIFAWNKRIDEISSAKKKSHSIRALIKNKWVFASSDNDDIKELIEKVLKAGKSISRYDCIKYSIKRMPAIKDKKTVAMKKNPADVSFDDKRRLLLSLSRKGLSEKNIKSMQVSYSHVNKKKYFENSEGSSIHQNLVYTRFLLSATAMSAGRTEDYIEAYGEQAGYEVLDKIYNKYDECVQNSRRLLKARSIKAGNYPVIIEGDLASVFVHEALGHASEADHIESKYSCLIGKEGRRIAPKFLNIYDDPTIKGLWGSYFYDDEGVKARKTIIIKEGIMNSFLHSRETSSKYKKELTANSRAESPHSIPLVRMSNTIMGKGDYKKEELFSDIKNGVYLVGSKGGQVNPFNGNFQFAASKGYIVKNGEIKDMLREVSLAGNTLDILTRIRKVANEFDEPFVGHCGKGGQHVPVIGMCPSIMIEPASVGGR